MAFPQPVCWSIRRAGVPVAGAKGLQVCGLKVCRFFNHAAAWGAVWHRSTLPSHGPGADSPAGLRRGGVGLRRAGYFGVRPSYPCTGPAWRWARWAEATHQPDLKDRQEQVFPIVGNLPASFVGRMCGVRWRSMSGLAGYGTAGLMLTRPARRPISTSCAVGEASDAILLK
jgi:hypothetical protein